MVSPTQKISYPLAILFHWQKNSSDQKALFPLDRKSVSTSRMKDLLKNAFPLYEKVALNLKIFENTEKTCAH